MIEIENSARCILNVIYTSTRSKKYCDCTGNRLSIFTEFSRPLLITNVVLKSLSSGKLSIANHCILRKETCYLITVMYIDDVDGKSFQIHIPFQTEQNSFKIFTFASILLTKYGPKCCRRGMLLVHSWANRCTTEKEMKKGNTCESTAAKLNANYNRPLS